MLKIVCPHFPDLAILQVLRLYLSLIKITYQCLYECSYLLFFNILHPSTYCISLNQFGLHVLNIFACFYHCNYYKYNNNAARSIHQVTLSYAYVYMWIQVHKDDIRIFLICRMIYSKAQVFLYLKSCHLQMHNVYIILFFITPYLKRKFRDRK